MRYKTIKILERKETRFTALIEYGQKIAVLKKILFKDSLSIDRFSKERKILSSIDRDYVPKVYEYGDDYIIMEYFETRFNTPKEFAQNMTKEISDKILNQLIDINTTKLEGIVNSSNRPLSSIYRVIAKSIRDFNFRFFYIKTLYLSTVIYLKNRRAFSSTIASKGDFTEVNILVTKNSEVKFIDFDGYHSEGSWVEDASYLLLHQDIEVEELSWQIDFFKKYLHRVHNDFLLLDREYIRFWLLNTSLIQYSIRDMQYRKNLISREELKVKEQHLRYFLDDKKSDKFLSTMGFC